MARAKRVFVSRGCAGAWIGVAALVLFCLASAGCVGVRENREEFGRREERPRRPHEIEVLEGRPHDRYEALGTVRAHREMGEEEWRNHEDHRGDRDWRGDADARDQLVGELKEEASRLGADAIMDVRISTRSEGPRGEMRAEAEAIRWLPPPEPRPRDEDEDRR